MEAKRTAIKAAWDLAAPQLPPSPAQAPDRLYLSIDGTTVQTQEDTITPFQRTDSWEVRVQEVNFYADFAGLEGFGRTLWLERYRRGVTQAK